MRKQRVILKHEADATLLRRKAEALPRVKPRFRSELN